MSPCWNPSLMNPALFYDEIRKSTGAAQQKELLIFIHGFNVAYADAMRRTGQIVYDLGFGGVSFCYSWPSQGDFTKDPVDKENSEWTIPHLTKVLTDLQKETKSEEVPRHRPQHGDARPELRSARCARRWVQSRLEAT